MTQRIPMKRIGPFAALSYRFVFESDDEQLLAFLGHAFGDLRTASPANSTIRISLTGQGNRYLLDVDRERRSSMLWPSLVPETVMSVVNAAAAASWPTPVIHGAVVEIAGTTVLLVGESGSGKTSLSAALVANGARYLSDEFAPLCDGGVGVQPYSRPLSVKLAGSNVLDPLVAGLPTVSRFEQRIRLVPASSIGQLAKAAVSQVGLVVLLGKIDPSSVRPTLVSVPRSAAVRALAESSIHLGRSNQVGLNFLKKCVSAADLLLMDGGELQQRRGAVEAATTQSRRR